MDEKTQSVVPCIDTKGKWQKMSTWKKEDISNGKKKKNLHEIEMRPRSDSNGKIEISQGVAREGSSGERAPVSAQAAG